MKHTHEQEKIDELILDWYRLSTGDEIDQANPFFRFVAVWVAFNAFYSSRMYDVGNSGIAQVHAFARQAEVLNQHKMLLDTDSEYRKAVEVFQEKSVYNTQKVVHHGKSMIERISYRSRVAFTKFATTSSTEARARQV